MHCNLRPPEPRQSFPALITVRRHAKFEVAEPPGAALAGKILPRTAYHQIWPPLTYVEVKCYFTSVVIRV